MQGAQPNIISILDPNSMIILIAESKTMLDCDQVVSPELQSLYTPSSLHQAREIMDNILSMPVDELSRKTKLSAALTSKLIKMAYEFPNKGCGLPALAAYTGVVFKALDYSSLSGEARAYASKHVEILSSLYGILHADDIIKSYRLDFTNTVAPDGSSLASWWRTMVTQALSYDIEMEGSFEVLDLLPGDAAKMIDWESLPTNVNVKKGVFLELKPGGGYKTPTSNKLKTLRGTLLRQILQEQIPDFASLAKISNPVFAPELIDSELAFIVS